MALARVFYVHLRHARSTPTRGTALLFMGVLWLGCSGGADTLASVTRAPDAAVDGASSSTTSDAGVSTPRPAADAGDSHVGFDTAHALAVDESMLQLVYSAGEATYFSFEARAGSFYVISTGNDPFSPDNTLRLYDAQLQLIATNDSGPLWPGDLVDARLMFRAAYDGRHYVRVQDESYAADTVGERFPSPLSYFLMVRTVEDGVRGFLRQGTDDAARPIELQTDGTGKYAYVTLFGVLAKDQTASFELSAKPNRALIGQLHPAGVHGNGSTAGALRVQVRDQADGHTLASIEQHEGFSAFHPPLGDGTYRVLIEQPEDPGHNGFYAVDLVLLDDNPREQAETANGQLAGAEPLLMTGTTRRRGRVLSRLPEADVDYYRFELTASAQMFAICEAESGGSGVRGLTATLIDAAERPLRAQQEPSETNLLLDVVRVDKAGTYFLKLQAEAPAKRGVDTIEPWVRCAVTAAP